MSIRGVMALVALLAVGLAALRYPTNLGASALFTLDLALLAAAVLGVLGLRDRARAFWAGGLVVGGGYLLLTLAPWLDNHIGHHLLTTALLDLAYPHVVATSRKGGLALPWATWVTLDPSAGNWSTDGPFVLVSTGLYRRIGHALIAPIAGLGGGLLARRFVDARGDRGRVAAERAVGILVKVLEASL